MIDATLTHKKDVKTMRGHAGEQVVNIRTYSIESILAADSTGVTESEDIRLATPHFTEGSIFGVRVSCLSTNYTLSIRTSPDVVLPSIQEILNISLINEDHDLPGLTTV